MGRGSVGPEIVGRRPDPIELVLVLVRGSVGLGRELPDAVRWNHFVGLNIEEKPEGEVERVMAGKEGEGLMPGWV